jgi:hypothetical protein
MDSTSLGSAASAAENALALDPQNVEAHGALG